MALYSYEELKRAASKARTRMAERGVSVEKMARRKPRDAEKRELILQRALQRLNQYPPLRTKKGILLPYFSGM